MSHRVIVTDPKDDRYRRVGTVAKLTEGGRYAAVWFPGETTKAFIEPGKLRLAPPTRTTAELIALLHRADPTGMRYVLAYANGTDYVNIDAVTDPAALGVDDESCALVIELTEDYDPRQF